MKLKKSKINLQKILNKCLYPTFFDKNTLKLKRITHLICSNRIFTL